MKIPSAYLVVICSLILLIGFTENAAAELNKIERTNGMSLIIVYNEFFTGGRSLTDPRVHLFVNGEEKFILGHGQAKSIITKPGEININVIAHALGDYDAVYKGSKIVKTQPDETYYLELIVNGGSLVEAGGFSLRPRSVAQFNEMVSKFPEEVVKKSDGLDVRASNAKVVKITAEKSRLEKEIQQLIKKQAVAEKLAAEKLVNAKLEAKRLAEEAVAVAVTQTEKLAEKMMHEAQRKAEREAAAKRKTEQLLAKKRVEENNQYGIAVVIGNRNYSQHNSDVPNVNYAHNDATAIYSYLKDQLKFKEGNIIFLKDALQADIISVFGNERSHKGKLFNWTQAGKSKVFVYYSGHGAPGLSDGAGYLLPVNADPMTVELNGYPLETLYSNLSKIPAKHITVVLDACFSGSSADGNLVKSASSIALRRVETKGVLNNGTVLSAADVSEVASWDNDRKMGLFTAHFLDGIQGAADKGEFGDGDGKIQLGELKKYVQTKVSYVARRNYYRDQNPQVSGDEKSVLNTLN